MIRLTVKQNLLKVCTVALFTAVLAETLGAGQAQALVLTFDDLSPTSEEGNPIPNGYGGLNWQNFYYLTTPNYNLYGYLYGTVSSPNVAYNGFGSPGTVSTVGLESGKFDFNSTYLTAAWNNGLDILVEGILGGVTKYSKMVTVDTTSAKLFNFDFLGIDSLRFTGFGGEPVYQDGGTHIVLDNFTYNSETVTEPTTILGLLAVASFGLGLNCKQKHEQKSS